MTDLLEPLVSTAIEPVPFIVNVKPHESDRNFCAKDVSPSEIYAEPSFGFECDVVTIRLFEKMKSLCKDFSLASCDKVIIPFSKLEMTYFVAGNSVSIELLPGQGFFIPTGFQGIEITSLQSSEFIMFDINESVRADLMSANPSLHRNLFRRAMMLPNAQHLLKFANTARRLLLSPVGANLAAIRALGIMAAAETITSLQNRTRACVNLSARMIAKIDNYINENIYRSLRLCDLAGICDMSTPHFSRQFKSAIGKSPYQYVLDRRVAHARRLLRETADSIADIAYGSGFSSQSHMTELFRKNVGITPAKYRGSTGAESH